MKEGSRAGLTTVTLSYVVWGVMPLFWNLLAEVNSVYILAQRILWSAAILGVYLAVSGRLGEVKRVFRQKKSLGICLSCGVLISISWGLYIYAVNSGYVLEASMGYFVQPVMVALVGLVVFRERPSVPEWITFGFAVLGIGYSFVRSGTFPVMGLAMAGAFVVYGALKKNLDVSPYTSLFVETVVLVPVCGVFSLWWVHHCGGMGAVMHGPPLPLLAASGAVTLLPMLLFNVGVQKIPYYVNGILMYINPTLQFLAGILFLGAALDPTRLTAFAIIWVGILFTVAEKGRMMRRGALPGEAPPLPDTAASSADDPLC